MRPFIRPKRSDFAYALGMAIACLISFWIITRMLARFVGGDQELLGGMWTAIAAAFVFRETRNDAWAASMARLIATAVSCVLCLALMMLNRPSAFGMTLILFAGTLLLIVLNRRDAIITMAITTIVIMIVAILDPADAKAQPMLRFIDTLVGVSVGLACQWLASVFM